MELTKQTQEVIEQELHRFLEEIKEADLDTINFGVTSDQEFRVVIIRRDEEMNFAGEQ